MYNPHHIPLPDQTAFAWPLLYLLGLLLITGTPVLAAEPGAAFNAEEARTLVMEKSRQLVSELKKNQAAIKENPQIAFDLADSSVIPYIDFEWAARNVLGKHWRDASSEQKQRFTAAFKAYLVNNYVNSMVKYVDEIVSHADSVEYPPLRQQDVGDRRVVVNSIITLSDGKRVLVNYRMYQNQGQWMIYDLVIENVSLAITHRSTFYAEIAAAGLDNLIRKLEQRYQPDKP